MDELNITIIGSGVVGLAIAAELSRNYDHIALLEKHETFGRETSSRNSEVIHSGIYYPHGSLKAKLCIEGAVLLYEICERNNIPVRKTGKLIVATQESEINEIERLLSNGERNGVAGLRLLGPSEVLKKEPHVMAVSALFSPGTGIIDSHSLMRHFHAVAASTDVLLSFGSEVGMIEQTKNGYVIGLRNDDYRFHTRVVINAAGLSSDRVAELAGMDIDAACYRLRYCKGSYFSYARKSPVGMLVYPVPHHDMAGLGVHATVDMAGRLRFGPDAEYVGAIDYSVDGSKASSFFYEASRFIRGLEPDFFLPDMAGIRPKLSGPAEMPRDFVIEDESDAGFPGLINLVGIESPGLTAAPAIAKRVEAIVSRLLS